LALLALALPQFVALFVAATRAILRLGQQLSTCNFLENYF